MVEGITPPWQPESEKPTLPFVICTDGDGHYWMGRWFYEEIVGAYSMGWKTAIPCTDLGVWMSGSMKPLAWCDPCEFVPFEKKKEQSISRGWKSFKTEWPEDGKPFWFCGENNYKDPRLDNNQLGVDKKSYLDTFGWGDLVWQYADFEIPHSPFHKKNELHFCCKDNYYCSEGSGYLDIWTKQNFLESSPVFLFKCQICPFCGYKAGEK